MNRPEPRNENQTARGDRFQPALFRLRVPGIFLALVVVGLVPLGCVPTNDLVLKEAQEEKEPAPNVKTLGDITSFGNTDPIRVDGVGLVVGLDGTGGDTPPAYRPIIEKLLQSQGETNIKELIDSPNSSVVIVTGLIPAGAHKGDPIDIEVGLPENSRTKSLRGGYLKECTLRIYESARNLAPNTARGDGSVAGHVYASASGSIQVDFGEGGEEARLKRGRIWGGGKSKISRELYLVLNPDQQFSRIAAAAADRVNETFHGPSRGMVNGIASAKNSQLVVLGVPPQYRLNLPRFMRVVRMIPLREEPENRLKYRRKLEEDLADPKHALTAALRLEALGDETIPVLKKGLKSDHVLVRFASAEALAYLRCTTCADELARLVDQQMALRAYCLTALGALNESVSHLKLRELLQSNKPETRYGAFKALYTLDENDEAVKGEMVNESFWLHQVAPQSPPLVHVSSSKRAEIVLFGEDMYLIPPFSILAGPEFTITAGKEDDRCTVGRFSAAQGSERTQCSLKLVDVLRTMGKMGGQYPDAVELIRKLDQNRSISCMMAVDAVPQPVSVYKLAKAGAGEASQSIDPELLESKEGFGATPTLFEKVTDRRKASDDDSEESDLAEREELIKAERKPYRPKPTWSK